MFITDEPRRRRMFPIALAVRNLVVIAIMVGVLPFAIQASPQGQPPTGSRTNYIRSLESPSRKEWQKPDWIVKRLKLKSGQRVADIGSGSGYFAIRFARAVKEAGKVYVVDVDPDMRNYVMWRANKEGLENLEAVEATFNNPRLGVSSVDMIFMCNTIHHIENRDRYYPRITRALKKGGRLVIVDFYERLLPVPSPPPEMKISRRDMIEELERAGFHLVEEYDFLPHQYFLVFELR